MARPETGDEPRRSQKWHARRDAIIDTSAHVFARRGYHATGISELCEANQLGKGGLYHYIGSKEQLLSAIHERVMDEVMVKADLVAGAGGSPAEQLARLGDELLGVIARYPDHVWVFLHEFPALTGDEAGDLGQRRREFEARVEAILRAGVDDGEFRELDPRLTTLAWIGMHNYTYRWLQASGAYSAHQLATAYSDIFIRGIVNPSRRAAKRR